MRSPVEDVNKLPQWAQRRIALLEANLRWTEDRLNAITGPEPAQTDTWVDIDRRVAVPRGTEALFNLAARGDDRELIVGVQRRTAGHLYVYARDCSLRVQPSASNVMMMWVGPYIS